MRLPKPNMGTDLLLEIARWHLAALRQVAETAELAEAFDPVVAELRAAGQEVRAAQDGMQGPQIALLLAEIETEKPIRRIASACGVIDGGKAGPTFKALFPKGLGAVVQPISQRQVDEGEGLMKRAEARKLLRHEQLAPHFAELRTNLERMKATLGQRAEAHAAVARARAAEMMAREDLCRAYAKHVGPIWQLYPQDRQMRELFFMPWGIQARSEEVEDEPPASGTVPPPA